MVLPIVTPNTQPDPQGDMAFLHENIVKPQLENLVVKKLATHIGKIWQQNQRDNKQVRTEMISALRRSRGEYEPMKLAAIRKFMGSEAYFRSAENKARSADSWVKDIYRGDTDLPWSLEPTALPDLPEETRQMIIQQTQQQASVIEQEILATGLMPDPLEVSRLMQKYYEEQLDKEQDNLRKTAEDKCKRAADAIRDQNQEGGWNDAFKEFLYYFIRLKAGIIKGPILTKKKKQSWQPTPGGGYELTTTDALVHDVYCVSPFNFFPSKGMKNINDGDVIEVHELSKQAIADLIGVPGYSDEEVRLVIDKYSSGSLKAKWFTIEDETAVKQVTKEKNYQNQTSPLTQNSTDLASETILAQEFYGTVSGSLLIEWGIEGEVDPQSQYQVNCWKIGDHVIKAVLNPDTLGRKPYHVSSWAKNPEWIWGEGLLEFAAPIEDAMNAIIRSMINNAAIASGPMVEEDKDRIEENTPIYPWRKIRSTSNQMKNDGPAVNYYQPQMHLQELISAWQFLSKVLDEMTVPAYAQGASQSGVTAGTATVFTQLLAAATRSIKAVVANLDDDIFTPYIQMSYDYLMKFSDDESIKGDARVVAKGVSGLLAKEQQSHQKIELLQMVSNPAYMQVLGAKNIGALLAQIIKGQDIELPDLDRLDGDEHADQIIQQILMSQAGVQAHTEDPNNMNGQAASGGGGIQQAQGELANGEKAGVALG